MRKVLKVAGLVLAVLAVVAGGFLIYVQIDGIPRYPVEKVSLQVEATPERLARGKKLVGVLCANCHLDPGTGQLTGRYMSDAPKEFGEIYSSNITRHPVKGIGSWTDGEIVYLLRTGVKRDGQYTPPWMVKLPHTSDEDLASIVAFLRSDDPMVAASDRDRPGITRPSFLTKLLCHVAFRKLPYPDGPITAPPATDRVAYGRYLVFGLECYGCHSADFKTMNIAAPEKSAGYLGGGNPLLDLNRQVIRSANLTPDEATGIGRWTEQDFQTALRHGFRPDRTAIRYPMPIAPELSDDEAGAIFAYLRSVPAIKHAVERTLPPAPSQISATDGKRLYQDYGCNSCHGKDGVGIADLRRAAEHYPTRDRLKAWIRNAPGIKPDTRMPSWDGVIREQDYEPLMDYVLLLGQPRSGVN